MTDHLTSAFVILTGIVIIGYDMWIVWTRGGNSTVSWVFATWAMVHPWILSALMMLVGHMFFPACAQTSTQGVSPAAGSALGTLAIIGILTFLAYLLHQPEKTAGPTVSTSYLRRLAALAAVSLFAGHYLFTQYVSCHG